jgi:starvation-inducible DNA-binding protein
MSDRNAQSVGPASTDPDRTETGMHSSPSKLPPKSWTAICAALTPVLVDGIDLHSQIKVAHWNIKGPHFAALHPLFDTFATELAAHNDEIAERILTLGGLAVGTARHVAKKSSLPDYPQDLTQDLEHAALLAARIESYLVTVRRAALYDGRCRLPAIAASSLGRADHRAWQQWRFDVEPAAIAARDRVHGTGGRRELPRCIAIGR